MANYTPEELFDIMEDYVELRAPEMYSVNDAIKGLTPGKRPTPIETAAIYTACQIVDRLYIAGSFMKDLSTEAKIEEDRLNGVRMMLDVLDKIKPATDQIKKQGGFNNDK